MEQYFPKQVAGLFQNIVKLVLSGQPWGLKCPLSRGCLFKAGSHRTRGQLEVPLSMMERILQQLSWPILNPRQTFPVLPIYHPYYTKVD